MLIGMLIGMLTGVLIMLLFLRIGPSKCDNSWWFFEIWRLSWVEYYLGSLRMLNCMLINIDSWCLVLVIKRDMLRLAIGDSFLGLSLMEIILRPWSWYALLRTVMNRVAMRRVYMSWSTSIDHCGLWILRIRVGRWNHSTILDMMILSSWVLRRCIDPMNFTLIKNFLRILWDLFRSPFSEIALFDLIISKRVKTWYLNFRHWAVSWMILILFSQSI